MSNETKPPNIECKKWENSNLLAYTSGIIDGEGCLLIGKTNSNHYPTSIKVMQRDKQLIDFLYLNFRGFTTTYYSKKYKCNYYRWELIKHSNIIKFLNQIIPYLLIKRKQAELLLDFCKQRENILNLPKEKRGYTNAQIKIYQELKQLKKQYPTELPAYNWSEEEKLYYLAGLVDGEGAVRINKALHKNEYGNNKLILTPLITIANTDKRMMDFLLKEFGGFIHTKKREGKWKTIHQWYLQGNNKLEQFKRLEGKLIVKQKQLDLLFQYLQSRKNNYVRTQEELEIFLKLRELNRKGKEEYDKEELLKYSIINAKPRKFFITKEELYDLYDNKKLSTRQIAKKYNIRMSSVLLRMKKYSIARRISCKDRHNFSRDQLYDLYINQRLSTQQIGDRLNTSASVINHHLRKYNIHIRKVGEAKSKINATKERLIELYVNQRLTLKQIGKMFNVTKQSVRKKLIKFCIQRRTMGESLKKLNIPKEELIKLHQTKTLKQIADQFGVCQTTIFKHLH